MSHPAASSSAATVAPQVSGNWSFRISQEANATNGVALNAGFNSSGSQASGVAHIVDSSCADPKANIRLGGSVESDNQLTLTSQVFDGTMLSITGQLSADRRNLSHVKYTFTGGACGAALGEGDTFGTRYANISGSYTGNFTDAQADQIPVVADLTQTTQADSNGQFHLSGSATFPNSTCFPSQPIITDSLVTGSSLSTTYSATNNGQTATITATGTFNSDATQLTMTSWTVTGGECDGMTGTGLLSKQ
jgi:hypothetical protein